VISVTSLGLKFLNNTHAEGIFLRINHHEKDEVKGSHNVFKVISFYRIIACEIKKNVLSIKEF
jgi:hypothetical protein